MIKKNYIDLHVKHSLFLSHFNETKFFRQNFEKYSDIKFNENLASGNRVTRCGRTAMTMLIVDFRNFANVPKKRPDKWRYEIIKCRGGGGGGKMEIKNFFFKKRVKGEKKNNIFLNKSY